MLSPRHDEAVYNSHPNDGQAIGLYLVKPAVRFYVLSITHKVNFKLSHSERHPATEAKGLESKHNRSGKMEYRTDDWTTLIQRKRQARHNIVK